MHCSRIITLCVKSLGLLPHTRSVFIINASKRTSPGIHYQMFLCEKLRADAFLHGSLATSKKTSRQSARLANDSKVSLSFHG